MSSIFGGSTRSHRPAHSKSSRSPSGIYIRPSASRSAPSIFGGGSSSSHHHKHHSSSTSSYRRRPRDGYIAYLFAKLKRLVSDLWRYARRHPVKAFFAVVVPLLSAGGAVSALLRTAGVSVPLLSAFGAAGGGGGGRGGGGYYGSSGYDFDRGSSGGSDLMGSLGQVVKIAQAFI